ncbi:MAG: FAD-binding protein [Clostridia bacterium]|nr:FAD-binding protein [Clostridia bacterium]
MLTTFPYNRSLSRTAADILVIGGGPAGLCAAAALALQNNTDVRTLDTASLRNVLREQKVLLDV